MAIKPTIYKLKLELSDTDRNYYDSLNLTLALHPSETLQRMMVRVLAYCINAEPTLQFTRGLSDSDEPAIWSHSLDGQLLHWIDVGEPSSGRIKKATRQSVNTSIYSFNSRSETWWSQQRTACEKLKLSVFRFSPDQIETLAQLCQRTMNLAVMISDQSAYIATELGECEVSWTTLQGTD